MENASKQLQNDKEEDDLFVLWFYTLMSLSSLKKKENQKLKKFFLSDWKYIIRTIIWGKFDPSRTKLEEKQYPC